MLTLPTQTYLSVCMARLRELYREGSPTQAVSLAFFRAARCFLGFPVGEAADHTTQGTLAAPAPSTNTKRGTSSPPIRVQHQGAPTTVLFSSHTCELRQFLCSFVLGGDQAHLDGEQPQGVYSLIHSFTH